MIKKNELLLNIAGIINILQGSLICIYNPLAIYGLFVIALGICFISISKKSIKEQEEKRTFLLVVAIINLTASFIGSILAFIVYSNINEYRKNSNGINAPPEIKEKNQEKNNIDLLLKLGVAMVFISGILFATTTWSFITDFMKVIALIAFGILFVGLSYLTGEKLKLEKSSYVYWILGMLFFVLTVVAAEYFELFGPFLTFYGDGKNLAYFTIALVIGVFSHLTYYKYQKKYLIYIFYISYLIATHNVIMQAYPSIIFSLIVLSVMNIITYLIDKKEKLLNEISNIFVYVLALLISANVFNEEMIILKLLAMFIGIISILYLKINNEEEPLDLFGILITYILVTTTIASTNVSIIPKLLIIFILLTIYSIYNNLNENSNISTEVNNIIYTILTLSVYLIYLNENVLYALLVAVIYLILSATSKFNINWINESKIFDIALPITVPFIIFPFGDLLGLSPSINYAYGLAVSSALYCVGHYVLNSETEKKRFIIYAFISTILCLLASAELDEIMISIFPIISSLYLMGIFYNHKIKNYVIGPYILFLLSIFIPLVCVNIFDIHIIFTTILFIWILIMLMILLESDLIKMITEIAIVVPLFNLIVQQDLSNVFKTISISILILYLTFVIIKYFIKKNKCMWAMIGLCISLISVIFHTNIYYALYVGLLGILVVIFGYNSKTYSKLFKFGIGIIIVNIIIQLNSLWEKIPFYLYLLLCGLGIILFVTYKEMKKRDK